MAGRTWGRRHARGTGFSSSLPAGRECRLLTYLLCAVGAALLGLAIYIAWELQKAAVQQQHEHELLAKETQFVRSSTAALQARRLQDEQPELSVLLAPEARNLAMAADPTLRIAYVEMSSVPPLPILAGDFSKCGRGWQSTTAA